MKKKIGIFDYILVILMILLILTWLFPFWYIFVISVSTPEAYLNSKYNLWITDFTLDQYINILQSDAVMRALFVSIGVTIAGTALALLLTIPCAYAIAHTEFGASKLFSLITIIPMLFTGGLIPYYLQVARLGLPDTFFVLFVPVAVSSYNLLIAKSFMKTIDRNMEEAAYIDGANNIQVFIRIVVPLSIPLITALGMFYGVALYNDYFTPMLFLHNRDLYPIQLLLREMVINNEGISRIASQMRGNRGFVPEPFKMACVIVGLLPIIIAFPFVQRYFTTGIMLGAVKE